MLKDFWCSAARYTVIDNKDSEAEDILEVFPVVVLERFNNGGQTGASCSVIRRAVKLDLFVLQLIMLHDCIMSLDLIHHLKGTCHFATV